MALSDPELELLSELLLEMPTADCLFSVTETLIQRGRYVEALGFFRAAKADEMEDPACWLPYALAASQCGQHDEALEALSELKESDFADESVAAARVTICGCCGELTAARSYAKGYFDQFGPNAQLKSFVDGLREDRLDDEIIALDPFVSNRRAEAFVQIGRVDRAIRIYRRLTHHYPDRAALQRRLQALLTGELLVEDDLSEELSLQERPLEMSGLPDFSMPSPAITLNDAELDTWIKASGVCYDVPIYSPTIGSRVVISEGVQAVAPTSLEVDRAALREMACLADEEWDDEQTDPLGFEPADHETDPEGTLIEETPIRPEAAPTPVVSPGQETRVQTQVKRARRRRSLLKK